MEPGERETMPAGAAAAIVLVVMTVVLLLVLLVALGTPRQSEEGTMSDEQWRRDRERMVELIARRGIDDERVLEALRRVPRHEFVPGPLRERAYDDSPLPIGAGQTISQPYVVALMSAALELEGGERVLELGTGSGYQAAMLAELADSVFTIEYFPELADSARATLERLGYAGVQVRAGDGWRGWPGKAPFDAALITFATPEIPPALLEQVRSGGPICAPLGPSGGTQELTVVRKRPDGRVERSSMGAVRFVPVQGEGAR
ncbi:MAG: protein-L-isoaspartate(D-aspartate) O-methyltransferase [Candidatus Krumholzibacteriia bacterium]